MAESRITPRRLLTGAACALAVSGGLSACGSGGQSSRNERSSGRVTPLTSGQNSGGGEQYSVLASVDCQLLPGTKLLPVSSETAKGLNETEQQAAGQQMGFVACATALSLKEIDSSGLTIVTSLSAAPDDTCQIEGVRLSRSDKPVTNAQIDAAKGRPYKDLAVICSPGAGPIGPAVPSGPSS